MTLLLAILGLVVVGAGLVISGGRTRLRDGMLAALPTTAAFVALLMWTPNALETPIHATMPWVPSLDVALSFHIDALSILLGLVVTGVGAAVFTYAAAYFSDDDNGRRSLGMLVLFAAAMLVLVLTDDVIVLFVSWETTSVLSFLLVGHKHKDAAARIAARRALLTTGAGGVALLAGLLMLQQAAGSASLSTIIAARDTVAAHPLFDWGIGLIAFGALTKSAQFPFHYWLPGAMKAPTPVSAYLHSATMVKAGIYLLARVAPLGNASTVWEPLLIGAGGLTMVVATVVAAKDRDAKALLAWSTLIALGSLTMMVGIANGKATAAFATLLVAHASYKGSLFLVIGQIDHVTGTRDITKLSGLRKTMPLTFIAALFAFVSAAGVPLTLGFVGKELLYKATLVGPLPIVVTAVAVIGNAMAIAVLFRSMMLPFLRSAGPDTPVDASETASWTLQPLALAFGGIVAGILAAPLGRTLLAPAAALAGRDEPYALAAWFGFDLALAMSGVTLALSGVLVAAWWPLARAARRVLGDSAPGALFEQGLSALVAGAAAMTRRLQHGRLRAYLAVILAAGGALLVSAAWLDRGDLPPIATAPNLKIGLAALLPLGAAIAIAARRPLTAVTSLGVTGIAIALIFLRYGAPDLALTQLLVETLLVVIFALVLARVPTPTLSMPEPWFHKVRDAGIAIVVGGGVTAALLATQSVPIDMTVSDFYGEQSVPGGYGRNVVNVILVDFRALDTMGEIVVLMLAAVGVAALLRTLSNSSTGMIGAIGKDNASPFITANREPAEEGIGSSLVLRTIVPALMPLLLLFAIFLFLRGHHEPGGGFIGGLVASAAIGLLVFSHGGAATQRAFRLKPRVLMASGIAVALLAGLIGLASEGSFLEGAWFELPIGGTKIKLGTPLLFDLGVFMVVVGTMQMMLLALIDKNASETSDLPPASSSLPEQDDETSVTEAPR